jgi:hypothetical protein
MNTDSPILNFLISIPCFVVDSVFWLLLTDDVLAAFSAVLGVVTPTPVEPDRCLVTWMAGLEVESSTSSHLFDVFLDGVAPIDL